MSVLTKTTHRRKHAMEELLLLSLRFRCFMSKAEDLNTDPAVLASAHRLLRRIKAHLPSPEFQSTYMDRMATIGFDGRFALYIDHNMIGVTVVRTETFTNVLQFCRWAA
jgi:hypothetical protein